MCEALQSIAKPLDALIGEIILSPQLITTIRDTRPGDAWLGAVRELEDKVRAVRGRGDVRAAHDVGMVVEGLRQKVSGAASRETERRWRRCASDARWRCRHGTLMASERQCPIERGEARIGGATSGSSTAITGEMRIIASRGVSENRRPGGQALFERQPGWEARKW